MPLNNINLQLNTLDWSLFAFGTLIAPIAVICSSFFLKKSSTNNSYLEHLSMGRRLSLPLFVTTLVTTWYGGVLGVTDLAYDKGIYNFITQGLFWYISYLLFAFFFIKKIRRLNAYTLPEVVGSFFGPKAEKLAAILNFINLIPIAYAISVGYFLQLFLGGDLWLNSTIGVLFVSLYSSWGGIRAVVYSDVVQFVLMFFAAFLLVIFSFSQFGGLHYLETKLPSHHFHLSSDLSIGALIVWGLVSLTTLVDPNFYHRCLAAKDTKTAKVGILISTSIWFIFDICTTLGGMYARAMYQETQFDGSPYLHYAMDILPHGLKGIFLAGVLATILSTLDSYLFLSSATLTHNFFPKGWKDKKRVQIIAVFVIALLSASLSAAFSGEIAQVWLFTGGLSASCLLVPMMLALYSKLRPSPSLFLAPFFAGLSVTIIVELSNYCFDSNLKAFLFGTVASFLSLIPSFLLKRKESL